MFYQTQLTLFFFMFILAFLTFVSVTKHFLSSLICLEYMALTLFFIFILMTFMTYNEMFNSFLYISMTSCEAALGLSLIVMYVRKKGNDLLKFY